jgi:hypothetical protein
MTENRQPDLNSQPQSVEQVPEMDLAAFRKLMRNAFGIASEPSDANPKLTRFIESPYNPHVSAAVSVEGHAGGTKISPHNILAVLTKFKIELKNFLEALNVAQETAPSPQKAQPPSISGTKRPN